MAEYEWCEDYDHLVLIGVQGALSAGKTTIRNTLVNVMGFKAVSMADPLKLALMAMGATKAEVYGEDKAKVNELWGDKTNRHAMQTLGTEWGRRIIHPDVWVECIRRRIDKAYRTYIRNNSDEGGCKLREAAFRDAEALRLVIDDVRFPNEAEMIHDFGGSVWTVRRESVEYAEVKQRLLRTLGWWAGRWLGIHESERWWPMAPADVVIANDGTESQLVEVIKANYGAMYR